MGWSLVTDDVRHQQKVLKKLYMLIIITITLLQVVHISFCMLQYLKYIASLAIEFNLPMH